MNFPFTLFEFYYRNWNVKFKNIQILKLSNNNKMVNIYLNIKFLLKF